MGTKTTRGKTNRQKKKIPTVAGLTDIKDVSIHNRIESHVAEFNKVFDKIDGKKQNRNKIVEIMHKVLDRLSIDEDNMLIDMLPLSLLNNSLQKETSVAMGYCVYVDSKHKIHTLIIDGDKNKIDKLFIEGEV